MGIAVQSSSSLFHVLHVVPADCHTTTQSKVMLRLEEPGTGFVRLLVRSVVLPPPAAAASPAVPTAGQASTEGDDEHDGSSKQPQLEVSTSPGSAVDSESSDAAAALSPGAVETMLSSQRGCEVLYQEESRWLVVSETFSPGDICRWGYLMQGLKQMICLQDSCIWCQASSCVRGIQASPAHCVWATVAVLGMPTLNQVCPPSFIQIFGPSHVCCLVLLRAVPVDPLSGLQAGV